MTSGTNKLRVLIQMTVKTNFMTSIIFENSYILAFYYIKATDSKFDLAVTKVKVYSRSPSFEQSCLYSNNNATYQFKGHQSIGSGDDFYRFSPCAGVAAVTADNSCLTRSLQVYIQSLTTASGTRIFGSVVEH